MDPSVFRDPPNRYRITPFWFWNGSMDPPEVRRQLREMATHGVGGFFLCPRQGLTIPYLSDGWFETVRMAVAEAADLGLAVWLYDELPYPSGMAGGEVLLHHPDARHRLLEMKTIEGEGGEPLRLDLPWARVLSALAVPQRSDAEWDWPAARDVRSAIGSLPERYFSQGGALTTLHTLRFFSYEPRLYLEWKAPEGSRWKVLVFLERELGAFKYFGSFVDPGHREAVGEFIRLTHDRYQEAVGDYFGTVIRGIFSDEVFYLGRRPWSSRLLDYFLTHRGYDLVPHFPHLYFPVDDRTARIRYDYYQTAHELLTESYHAQIRAWCDDHGLEYAAEVPTLRMSGQRHSHIPGGDSAHEKLGERLHTVLTKNAGHLRADPKSISSLARQLSRPEALIECFHSVGWSMTLQDAKWMLDRLAVMGINHFTFHAFYYSVDGLRKHDAPPSQFLQNPYWPYFKLLGDYAGRLAYWESQGRADIPVALMTPTTTRWTQVIPEDAGPDPWSEAARELAVTLLTHQIDFDWIDPEMLAVADVTDAGTLILGHAEYRALIAPPLANLEDGAWTRMKAFAEAGGLVAIMAPGPTEVIGDPRVPEEIADAAQSTEPLAGGSPWLQGRSGFLVLPDGVGGERSAPEAVVDLLHARGLPEVRVTGPAAFTSTILLQSRIADDGSRLILASNQEGANGEVIVAVPAVASHVVECWHLDSGRVERIPEVTAGNVPIKVAPYACVALRITQETVASSPDPSPFRWTVDAGGDWEVSDDEPNVLRFGRFEFWVQGTRWSEWVSPKPIAVVFSELAQSRDLPPLPLRFDHGFGIPPRPEVRYPLTVEYRATFRVSVVPSACSLFMDAHAIRGDAEIRVNQQAVPREAFERRRRYDADNVEAVIRPYLCLGLNTLTMRMEASEDDDGLLDPLYLVGAFGVQWDPAGLPDLVDRSRRAERLARVPDDRPYYAGRRRFRRTVMLDPPAHGRFELRFENWPSEFHEAAEVRINGEAVEARAWIPYTFSGNCDRLCAGANLVEVVVCQSLSHLFEGRYFDYERREMRPVNWFD